MAVARRRVDIEEGRAALAAWRAAVEPSGTAAGSPGAAAGNAPSRSLIATAVRYSLEEVTARAPGNSVEVRVPPFGVTQCVEGPRHTRGTPPNVIECDAATWLSLVTGSLSWADAVSTHRVTASGLRANLSELLPL
ncbi:sterol carrier family protein [Paenarthrobacter sp. YAF11_1]|uniref:sterol carrier family protein n=1 Tax=Paenarthrobacter sp. YAF11_1 TaxID=3233074 RepID=UPI003F99493E